ncbi:fibronectin type III domain-containing protein, partial [bacterium]|nr:fibronectin type III domain-containing protein [bacterium]
AAPTSPPAAPVIASASSISTTGFTANWQTASGATKYYLDVATDSGFSAFITGFNNLDVGNVTSYPVTGLTAGTTYYYRVRAYNSAGTSANSQNQVVLTTSAVAPSITPSVASLTGFNYNGVGPSTAQSITLSVANLTGFPGTVTVNGSTNYEVSTTSSTTGFGSSATLSYSDANTLASSTVWVRLRAGLAAGTYNSETISISGGGATASSTASGSVTVPVISVTTTNLGSFLGTNGVGSAPKTNTITGTNLVGDVTMVATNYFELSTNNGTTYSTNVVLTPSAGVISNAVLFRIAPNAPVGSLGTNQVVISSPAASNKTVQVAGTVVYGMVTMSIAGTNTATVAEGGAPLIMDVTLSAAAPAGGTTVTLTTSDTDNSELSVSPSTVVFAEGETAKTVTLTPLSDNIFDPSQTIIITATATNWSVAGTVTVTVTNTEPMPISYISLTSLNPNSYAQNFDVLGTASIPGAISSTVGLQSSLGAYVGSSALNGWYATKVAGSGTTATAITPEAGSGTSGFIYSYGSASATDRALGVLASGSNTMAIGALIKNDTGSTINSIKVSFTAEFWRSSTTTQNVLTCAVGKVDGNTITVDNFLTASSAIPLVGLNIVGPAPVTTNGALDGNAAPNRATFSNLMLPVQLAPGEIAFVRWVDKDDTGNDAGLAIDDLSMTASLEAATSDGDGTVTIANNTPGSPYALSGIWPRSGTGQGVSLTVTPVLETTTLTSVSILVPADFGAPATGNVASSGGAAG